MALKVSKPVRRRYYTHINNYVTPKGPFPIYFLFNTVQNKYVANAFFNIKDNASENLLKEGQPSNDRGS